MLKSRNFLYATLFLFILVLSISVYFAYFTVQFQGSEEEDSISLISGKMTMHFDGGNNISVANIFPSEDPVATKVFTVTGNNTTDLDMGFSLYLKIDENTFSEYAIQYKLFS